MANPELARAEAALAEIAEHSHGILSGRAAQVLLDEMRRLRANDTELREASKQPRKGKDHV